VREKADTFPSHRRRRQRSFANGTIAKAVPSPFGDSRAAIDSPRTDPSLRSVESHFLICAPLRCAQAYGVRKRACSFLPSTYETACAQDRAHAVSTFASLKDRLYWATLIHPPSAAPQDRPCRGLVLRQLRIIRPDFHSLRWAVGPSSTQGQAVRVYSLTCLRHCLIPHCPTQPGPDFTGFLQRPQYSSVTMQRETCAALGNSGFRTIRKQTHTYP